MSPVWLKYIYSVLCALTWRPMPAAARSRLCSSVSAWLGAFARIAMSSALSASVIVFAGYLQLFFFVSLKPFSLILSIDVLMLYFDLWPGQKCHSKVMHLKEVTHSNGSYERKSCGRKLADEMGRGKKFSWYSHRLTHRKRVTSELHDSYFRLMTIKHAISKIEWAIEWALNYYITQSRQKPRQLSGVPASCSRVGERCGWESHTRPKGLGALMNWGPEKMLIRCSKESQHPAEWTPGPPVEHQENEKGTTLTAISLRVKILPFLFGLQHPLTRKPWVTLFEPLQ